MTDTNDAEGARTMAGALRALLRGDSVSALVDQAAALLSERPETSADDDKPR